MMMITLLQYIYKEPYALKWICTLVCLTPAVWNCLIPFYKTKQRDKTISNFYLTKIELSHFSSPSIGSFISWLSILRSLVRGQVVVIILKKHKNITILKSRELMCNIRTALNFKALMQIMNCALSEHHILQRITYLSNFRKLLTCVGTICIREPAQGIRWQKPKLLMYFLRKAILCSETRLYISWSQNDHTTAKEFRK